MTEPKKLFVLKPHPNRECAQCGYKTYQKATPAEIISAALATGEVVRVEDVEKNIPVIIDWIDYKLQNEGDVSLVEFKQWLYELFKIKAGERA